MRPDTRGSTSGPQSARERLLITRRQALSLSLSAGLAAVLPDVAAAQASDDLTSLGAVLDALLPDDGVTPAATALGIEHDLRGFLAGNDMLTQLFGAALGWMDQISGGSFRTASPDEQHDLLSQMSDADFNQIPGRFYHIIRALAVEFYYARPEALAGLPINPAPQPLGYPPPWA
ncbi:MAG: gluconate 2-dehydrogenase subunit 3 family protein [Paracoccaceae bacterium]